MTPPTTLAPGALEALDWEDLRADLAPFLESVGGRALLAATAPDAVAPELARDRAARGVEAAAAVGAPALGGLADLAALRERARRGALGGEELVAVAAGLERLAALRAWARDAGLEAWSARLAAPEWPAELVRTLREALEPRGRVRDEASPELARARADLAAAVAEHRARLEEVLEAWGRRGALRQRQPVRRGGRLLLAVRPGEVARREAVVHESSRSGDTLFVEPVAVLRLANRVEELRHLAARREREVLLRLTTAVVAEGDRVAACAAELAEADLVLGAVRWAAARGAAWPRLVGPDAPLRLLGARHPLLVAELGAEAVVPLDLELGVDHDLLVVTGPNTGGKTVVLKTVGLASALAACGLPAPLEPRSEVPLWRGLGADVGDPQSLALDLSTFSGHLRRALAILERAGPGWLVLLDELGTGTDPEEGAALGRALLEAFLEAGAKVVANTHLGALKTFSLGRERAENASMEFDPATLSPRHRLLVGVPGASHALDVAEGLGAPAPLLERARALVRDGGGEELLAEAGSVRRRAELLRREAEERASEAEGLLRSAADERARARERARLREREAERLVLELQARLEEILEEGRRRVGGGLPAASRAAFEDLLDRLAAAVRGHDAAARFRAFVAGLRKGDAVWVPRLGEHARVLKVDRERERVRLRHGNLELELPWRELTWAAPPPPAEEAP